MGVIEGEPQSVIAPQPIDWEAREAELREGGGGNFGGGDYNDGGDGGSDGWHENHEPCKPPGQVLCAVGGAVLGVCLGTGSLMSYDAIATSSYKPQRKKTLKGTITPGSSIDYTKIPNKNAELGAFGAPILILTALGIVIGRKIGNRLRG